MMSFIIFLLIVFLLWPVGRLLWTAYFLKRQYNQAVNNARNAAEQARAASRPAGWAGPRRRKAKVVNANEGEYVEWEEVSVTETSTTETSDKSGRRTKVSTYVSEQVSDAEWEDV